VISDAGTLNTYLKLIPDHVAIPFRAELANWPRGSSAVCVYLGLKESPATLGLNGENHWVYGGYEHDRTAASGNPADGYYLSFASLKNPQARAHTAQIIMFARYGMFAEWAGGGWKRRGAAYEQIKRDLAQQLIARVEQRIPGFADLVAYVDVSTPVTMERFQGNPRGEFYGLAATPERVFQPWTSAVSPVENLYLTGADVMSPGIVGAMMGGVKTAGAVMGPLGFFRLMRTMIRAARHG
jgi:phytoene dehydrogenase-like protein